MPQMAPILWLNLFIMFVLMYVVFIIMNYFSSTPAKLAAKSVGTSIEEKNWKW